MSTVSEQQLKDMIKKINLCEAEIGKAIIGQKDIIRQTILAILSDGNVLLEGVPGLGKTELVKAISRVFQMSFSRIQFTPDLMPADVTGTSLILKEGDRNVFQFEPGPVFAQLCWRMRLTVLRLRHRRRFWRPCRKKRSLQGERPMNCPVRF